MPSQVFPLIWCMRLPPGGWVMRAGSPLMQRRISGLLIKSWLLLLPTASSSPFQFDLSERRRELAPGTLREGFGLSVTLKYVANLGLCGDAWAPKARLGFRGFLLLREEMDSGRHSCAWAPRVGFTQRCPARPAPLTARDAARGRGTGSRLPPGKAAWSHVPLSCLAPQFVNKELQVLMGYRERARWGALCFDPRVGWKLNFYPRENSSFGRSSAAVGGNKENHDCVLGRRNAEGSCAGSTESPFLVS